MSPTPDRLVTDTLEYDGGRRVTAYVPPAPPEAIAFAGDGQLIASWRPDLEAADLPSTMILGAHRLDDQTLRLREYSPGQVRNREEDPDEQRRDEECQRLRPAVAELLGLRDDLDPNRDATQSRPVRLAAAPPATSAKVLQFVRTIPSSPRRQRSFQPAPVASYSSTRARISPFSRLVGSSRS
jgi:hypothetical protein